MMKFKTKEECLEIIRNFAAPHIDIVYNPNLQAEADERYKIARSTEYAHAGSCADSDPVMLEHHNRLIFGSYIRPDCKTLEYDNNTRIHFIIHEIGHMLCKREIYDYEKHSPDLYGWAPTIKNGTAPFGAMEEMATGFMGFLWLAKLDIIFESIYYDSCTKEVSESLNFPNKTLYLSDFNFITDEYKVEDGKIWMACDADLSPTYRITNRSATTPEDYRNEVLFSPLINNFGTMYFYYLGVVDKTGNITGTISKEQINQNIENLCGLFKVHETDKADFKNYLLL